MSATLPNISDLSTWLGASLYTTAYRPVHLDIKVCMDRSIYNVVAKTSPEVTSDSAGRIHQMMSEFAEKTRRSEIERERPQPHCIYSCDDNSNDSLNVAMHESFRIDIQSKSSSSSSSSSSTSLYAQVSAHSVRCMKSTSSSMATTFEASLQHERLLADVSRDDMEGLHKLCLETIVAGKSVMLFCNSKRRCEVCAKNIADAISSSEISKKGKKAPETSLQGLHFSDNKINAITSFPLKTGSQLQPLVATSLVINDKKSLTAKYSGAVLGEDSAAGTVDWSTTMLST